MLNDYVNQGSQEHITSVVSHRIHNFIVSRMDNQVHIWTVGDWRLTKSLVGHETASIHSASLRMDSRFSRPQRIERFVLGYRDWKTSSTVRFQGTYGFVVP